MKKIESILQRIELLLLQNKTVFTVAEFAAYTSLSISAVHKLTQNKRIRFSKPNGKVIFISKEAADAWLLSNPVVPEADIEKLAVDYTFKNSQKRWDAA